MTERITILLRLVQLRLQRLRTQPLPVQLVLGFYIFWFLMSGSYFLVEILQHGFLSHDVPFIYSLAWDCFAIIDAFMILLLVFNPRLGMVAGSLVIMAELSINTYLPYPKGISQIFITYTNFQFLEAGVAIIIILSLPVILLHVNE